MKEFFTSGVHGQTWEPNNLQCAVEALRLALKGRDEMSTNCRQKALSHSWTCSGKQIETIYADLIGQKEEKSKNAAGSVAVVARLVFYLTQWFFLMLLIVLFLAPIFSHIPSAAIAGVLIGTSFRIFNKASMLEIFRSSKSNIFIYVITALVTVSIDLIWGIAVGIALYLIINQFKRALFLLPPEKIRFPFRKKNPVLASSSAKIKNS